MTRAACSSCCVAALLLNVLVLALAAGPARGQSPSPTPAPAGEGSNPELRDELLGMMEKDQEVRKRWVQANNDLDAQADIQSEIRAVDATNSARLRGIIAKHGWPGISLVGKKGAGAAWTIVQHAEPLLQRQGLESMKAAAGKGDMPWPLVATTIDRVLVGEGKRQLYGTQFDGHMEPLPIEDAENVDKRRAEMGLPPLAEYKAQMRKVYGVESPAK
jgi:hypothetical protein